MGTELIGTELPAPGLPELLERHYHNLYPDGDSGDPSLEETCGLCREKIIEYLETNPSIAHEGILFIKKFTKVAKYILDSDHEPLDGLMERLYDFHLEGIMKIQQGTAEDLTDENLTIMKSHLHGHASDIAMNILNSVFNDEDTPFCRKMYWGVEAYNNGAMAIETSELNVLRLCIRQDYLGKISKRVYDLLCTKETPVEEKITWLKRYHVHKHAAAELSPGDDVVNESRRYHQSSEAALFVFMNMDGQEGFAADEKVHWLEIAVEDKIESVRLSAVEAPSVSAYRCKDAAEAYAMLYNLTEDTKYLHECHRMYNQAAKMTVNLLPAFSAAMEKYAGDAAIVISGGGKNGKWKRKAERHYRRYLRHYTSTDYALDEKRVRSRWKTNVDRVKDNIRKINNGKHKNMHLPDFK